MSYELRIKNYEYIKILNTIHYALYTIHYALYTIHNALTTFKIKK